MSGLEILKENAEESRMPQKKKKYDSKSVTSALEWMPDEVQSNM